MSSSTAPLVVQTPSRDCKPPSSDSRDLLCYLVAKYQTCAETGRVVKLGDAVVVEAEDRSTGKRATKLLCASAFEESWLPRLAALPFLPDVTVTVHDGREIVWDRG